MTAAQEGATVVPPAPDDPQTGECMGRWKHILQWVWVGGVWTDHKRCTTCGEEPEPQL